MRTKTKGLSQKVGREDNLSTENALRFIRILSTADGGCGYCIQDLLKKFVSAFPQHRNVTNQKLKIITKEMKK